MTEGPERDRLRATFDEVPDLYDRVRPTYPAELFDDLEALAGLHRGARVLEIGCGTGKATVPLAERGYEVLCLELGAGLAAVARRNLAAFPRVEIINAAYETWDSDVQPFDAVVAFTAFHWLDPGVAYVKSRRLLADEGKLAIVTTDHVRGEKAEPFWAEVQEDYVAFGEDEQSLPTPDDVDDLRGDIDASGFFETTAVRRYVWDVTYDAAGYLAVLDTYSGHRAMADGARADLYTRIRARIDATPSGSVTKTYLATLNVARPRARPSPARRWRRTRPDR